MKKMAFVFGLMLLTSFAFAQSPVTKSSFLFPLQEKDGLLHITYSYHRNNREKSIRYVVVDPKKITK